MGEQSKELYAFLGFCLAMEVVGDVGGYGQEEECDEMKLHRGKWNR